MLSPEPRTEEESVELSDVVADLPPRGRRLLVDVLVSLKDTSLWDGAEESVYDLIATMRPRTRAEVHASVDDVEDAGLCLLCGCYDAHGPNACDATDEEEVETLTDEYADDVGSEFEVLTREEQDTVLESARRPPTSLRAREVMWLVMALPCDERRSLADLLERRRDGRG